MSRVIALCVALSALGCSSSATPDPVPVERASPPLKPGIYAIATGERVSFEVMIEAARARRVVIIGESHADLWHHQAQLAVLRALSEDASAPVALGLEMFQHPFQAPLTAYATGTIDEAAMLTQTEYATRWGFDPNLYAPLWRHQRETGGALLALNARRELTKRVAQVGVAGLTAQERAELPELDMSDDAHRAWLRDIFAQHGGHAMDEAMLQRFYEAQLTWDETMAAKVEEHLQAAPATQVVVLAGSGHVVWGYGVPNRLKRRMGEGADAQVMTIIPITPGGPEPATQAAMARWREGKFADFVWVGEAR